MFPEQEVKVGGPSTQMLIVAAARCGELSRAFDGPLLYSNGKLIGDKGPHLLYV